MATFYCSTAGNDANDGTTIGSPWRHILFGAQRLAGGDTLLVRGGTYDEVLMNTAIAPGTAGAYTRIAAYPGTSSPAERDPSLAGKPAAWETVWIQPTVSTGTNAYVFYFQANQRYVELDGININALDSAYGPFTIGSVSGGNPHHFRVKNAEVIFGFNQVSAGGTVAFYLGANDELGATIPGWIGGNEFYNLKIHGAGIQSGDIITYTHYISSDDNVVGGCDLYNTGLAAIQVYDGYGGTPNGNILRNNWIHDVVLTTNYQPQYNGIVTATDSNTQIYNNVIWNIGVNDGNDCQGINLFSSNSSLVYNNTVYGRNNGHDTGIRVNSKSGTITAQNNISVNHAANFANFGSGTVQSTNLFDANPGFVNAAGADFRLTEGSVLARNTGTAIGLVTTDILGVSRPQNGLYDIGAFEFVSSTGAITITTATLPKGVVTVPYTRTLAASGGTAPYTWTVSGGALPIGVTLAATGVLSGTPSEAATSTFTLRATDAAGATATQPYTVIILPAVAVTTTTPLPVGALWAYSTTLAVAGDETPYVWSVVGGALPAGLTLTAGTGVISGTPTTTVNSGFTARVKGALGSTVTKWFALSIKAEYRPPGRQAEGVLFRRSTAPVNPKDQVGRGDIWVDLSVTPPQMKMCTAASATSAVWAVVP